LFGQGASTYIRWYQSKVANRKLPNMADDDRVTQQEWEATTKAIADLTTAMREGFQELRRSVTVPAELPEDGRPPPDRRYIDPSSTVLEPPTRVYQRRPRVEPVRTYQRRGRMPAEGVRRSPEPPFSRRPVDPPTINYQQGVSNYLDQFADLYEDEYEGLEDVMPRTYQRRQNYQRTRREHTDENDYGAVDQGHYQRKQGQYKLWH